MGGDMHHLLAKLELEGISIFSFKAVTGRLTQKIGLFSMSGGGTKFNASHTVYPGRIYTFGRARAHTHTLNNTHSVMSFWYFLSTFI